jgi:hypothetical protein
MPVLHVIDASRQLGVAGLTGRVDAGIFCDAMRAMYTDPDWEPGMRALWDLRYIDPLVVTPEDVPKMTQVVDSLRAVLGNGNAAFVAPHEPVHSIANLLVLRTHVPERQRRVFRQISDALTWLDVSLPDDYEFST